MKPQDRTTKEKLREIIDHKQQVIVQQAQEMEQLKAQFGEERKQLSMSVQQLKEQLAEDEASTGDAIRAMERMKDRADLLLGTIQQLTKASPF